MKRILFVMQWYNHETHKGIAQYAGEHGWHLNARMVIDGSVPKSWDGDGIITASPTGFPRIRQLVESTSAKTVYLSSFSDDGFQPSICVDHRKVASLAASYFFDKGFKRFVCGYNNGSGPSAMRHAFFTDEVKRRNGKVTSVNFLGDWINQVKQIRECLREQIFPIAVFTTEDEYAGNITEACAAEGLRVPEDVAILGVNNDETLCLACGVPVSSIECNLRQLGYDAAALLDRHMTDPTTPSEPHVLVHSPYVETRRSTDIMAVDNPGVARALQYIRQEFTDSIQIEDIVSVAGMSRAGLFNAFRDEVGRTPGREVTRLRLENAKRRLLESEDSLESIAFDAGFQTAQNMYVVFRKNLGISPSAFRKSGGKKPE